MKFEALLFFFYKRQNRLSKQCYRFNSW